MFRFHGVLGREAFAAAAALRIGLFLGAIVALPTIVVIVLALIPAFWGGDGLSALGFMSLAPYGWIYLKPLVYWLFVFSWLGIGVRRLRDIGLPGRFVAILVALFLGAASQGLWGFPSMGVFGSAEWTMPFITFVRYKLFAKYLMLAALACIAFLCLVDSDAKGRGMARFGATPVAAACVLVAILGMTLVGYVMLRWVHGIGEHPRTAADFHNLKAVLGAIRPPLMIATALLPLTLLAMLIKGRDGSSPALGAPSDAPARRRRAAAHADGALGAAPRPAQFGRRSR
ncbi:MAG: hypothetical protein R3D31_00820 [Hyphomicrobiaceae bacterium]